MGLHFTIKYYTGDAVEFRDRVVQRRCNFASMQLHIFSYPYVGIFRKFLR